MQERIQKLRELVMQGKMYVSPVPTEYDRMDMLLDEDEKNVKRLCEYILNQQPKITEYSALTGFFLFDNTVVGDAFNRAGYRHTAEFMKEFYLKGIDNLTVMEWQHATADYQKVLDVGLNGIIEEIDASIARHGKPEEIRYLEHLKTVANTLVLWARKCAGEVTKFAATVSGEAKKRLQKLAQALLRVPEMPPESFYEAVLTIYICYAADPDSIGTPDRYLSKFYKNDIKSGVLTKDEAMGYLQELFLMLQAKTKSTAKYFTRGAESHFCIGGYLPNGEDGFDEMSRLILESLMDLPCYCPQVTLRWTKKTPRETLRYVMDLERRDPYKRIAFTNDEARLKAFTEICGLSFERAVCYTTVGCNEPAFCGAITGSNSKINIARCVDRLFHEMGDKVTSAADFDEFFDIFEREMVADLTLGYQYDNRFNLQRAKDTGYISDLFFDGPIENAKSLTKGGCNTVMVSPMLIGITNVIDSLCVVRQMVFEEKRFSMADLVAAVEADWVGFEDMRLLILKKTDFFGNNGALSNDTARRFYQAIYKNFKDKTNVFGYHFLAGDLMGYNVHNKWFGEKTRALPDGRKSGDLLKFGLGQSEGKDREGLSALLSSIATADDTGIGCGCTITNITVDEQMVQNDESFEKLVDMFETYFKMGGVHFQLTYVSLEDLKKARISPEEYRSLRVRVTGFSEYFVKLKENIQDDIVRRTQHSR